MDIFDYYANIIKGSRKLVFALFGLFCFAMSMGVLYFYSNPHFIETIIAQYKNIIPFSSVPNRQLVGIIFMQNMIAAILSLFGGLFLGLLPVGIVFINGFIVGYVSQYVFASSHMSFFTTLVLFLASVLPHGIFELSAIFFAGAIGVWWGIGGFFPWFRIGIQDNSFKSRTLVSLAILPLIAVVLLLAAYIEVYVSMALVR